MKKSFKELAKKIDTLQEDKKGKLKGGFSTFKSVQTLDSTANNCLGGDCAAGCSIGEGLK